MEAVVLCLVLDLEVDKRGHFEKEGKDTQGMHKHDVSGCVLTSQVVFCWFCIQSEVFQRIRKCCLTVCTEQVT